MSGIQSWKSPGNPSCSPLLRRDFTGGTYGKAIVLLRPLIATNRNVQPTATTEYDTYSQTITLPGTYYQVMADGTISSTPITTTNLRAGEAGIYVTGGHRHDRPAPWSPGLFGFSVPGMACATGSLGR